MIYFSSTREQAEKEIVKALKKEVVMIIFVITKQTAVLNIHSRPPVGSFYKIVDMMIRKKIKIFMRTHAIKTLLDALKRRTSVVNYCFGLSLIFTLV